MPYLWDEKIKKDEIIKAGGEYLEDNFKKALIVANILISLGILIFFASFEIIQLIESGISYFT